MSYNRLTDISGLKGLGHLKVRMGKKLMADACMNDCSVALNCMIYNSEQEQTFCMNDCSVALKLYNKQFRAIYRTYTIIIVYMDVK